MDSLLCKLSVVRAGRRVPEFSSALGEPLEEDEQDVGTLASCRSNCQAALDRCQPEPEESTATPCPEEPSVAPRAREPLALDDGDEMEASHRASAQAAAEAAYRQRHALLVEKGLRYVNAPSGPVTALTDGCVEVKGRLQHGMPVRLLAVSGSHSKVIHEGQLDGVWIPSKVLVTAPPSRLAKSNQFSRQRVLPPATAQACRAPPDEQVDPALLPADAPPDHTAHIRVRYNGTHMNPLVSFRFDGMPFQTTVAAAGSRYAAEVIARACWLRFEKGWSKDDVLRFRNDCYDQLSRGSPAKRPRVERPEAMEVMSPASSPEESGAGA
uniref:Uncharacterized protein n=1 Tax=Alexandrium catenella TaxID=2925 RepID=A0A7S1WLN6_ALECA